jgi:UDP-glucose 4-epimerase
VAALDEVAGQKLPTREMPRRAGDPATLIADPTRIKSALGWKPRHDDIHDIVRSALEWERRLNS